MSPKLQVVVIGMHLAIALAVLVSVTVLECLGKPITAFVAGIFGTLIGLAGGSATAAATLGSALNGKSTIDTSVVAGMQHTIDGGQRLIAASGPLSTAAIQAAQSGTGGGGSE